MMVLPNSLPSSVVPFSWQHNNIFTGCWILLYLIGYSVVATCVYNVVDDVVRDENVVLIANTKTRTI